MYDERKLNAYWKKREEIQDNWYSNGWNGPGTPKDRLISYPCGHSVWAGYGLSDKEVLKSCYQCKIVKS